MTGGCDPVDWRSLNVIIGLDPVIQITLHFFKSPQEMTMPGKAKDIPGFKGDTFKS